jgi:hypothetical protein
MLLAPREDASCHSPLESAPADSGIAGRDLARNGPSTCGVGWWHHSKWAVMAVSADGHEANGILHDILGGTRQPRRLSTNANRRPS